jgi:PPP family 3-phenylpropionic acid transporter
MFLVVSCIIAAVAAFPLARLYHPLASALLLALQAIGFKSTTPLLDAITTIQIGETGNYGKIRIWGSIGFVVTALYLQWTPFFKPANAVHIAFWITVLAAVSIVPVLFLPSSKKPAEINTIINENPPQNSTKKFLSLYFITGIILIFFSRFSMVAIYTFFPLFLTKSLGWNAVALLFAIASATEIPCIFFSKILIRRFGSLFLLAVSAAAVFIRLVLLALFPFKPVIVALQLLHSLCFGFYHPAAIDFISRVFPPEKRGLGMSVFLVLGSGLPYLIGNIAGGIIVETAGYHPLFAIYAAVSGIAVLVYGVTINKEKRNEQLEMNN